SLLRWLFGAEAVDSCGNSTCLKTPQSGFLEEAEAVPAESNGPQRKTHALTSQFIYFVSKQQFFSVGRVSAVPVPIFEKRTVSKNNLYKKAFIKNKKTPPL